MSLSTDWTMLYVLVYGLDHLYVLVHLSIRTQIKKNELLDLLLPLFRCAMGEEQDKKKPDEDDEKKGADAASAKNDKKEKRSRSRRRGRSRRRRGRHVASEVSTGPKEGEASAPEEAEAASPGPATEGTVAPKARPPVPEPVSAPKAAPEVAPKPKVMQPPSPSSSEEEVEEEEPPGPPSPAAHSANRASTWCATCWREVGGGVGGYLAHVRSAKHFQWSLYNNDTRRGSRSWDELANEAQRLSNQAWEDAGEYNRRPMPRAEARALSQPAGRDRQVSVAPRRPYRRQLRSLPPPRGLAAMHSYHGPMKADDREPGRSMPPPPRPPSSRRSRTPRRGRSRSHSRRKKAKKKRSRSPLVDREESPGKKPHQDPPGSGRRWRKAGCPGTDLPEHAGGPHEVAG